MSMKKYSDQELLKINSLGIIPGPQETLEAFYNRLDHIRSFLACKHCSALDFLKNVYDVFPSWVDIEESNEALAPWFLGMTEVSEDHFLCSVRKKGAWQYRFCRQEEVIAHELIHASRMEFNEPIFEEFFAYWHSKSYLRRMFGPVFRCPKEVYYLLTGFSANFAVDIGSLFFNFVFLSCIVKSLLFTYLIFLTSRYVISKRIFFSCYNKLLSIVGTSAKAVLFRLSDMEIKQFARLSHSEITRFIANKAKSDLRFYIIQLAYFK